MQSQIKSYHTYQKKRIRILYQNWNYLPISYLNIETSYILHLPHDLQQWNYILQYMWHFSEISEILWVDGWNRFEKVLIFTSFKKMFQIFMRDLPQRFWIPINAINGETHMEERQKNVDEFYAFDGPALLILNPKSAGTCLNITEANHVIHFNPEWNPAVEDQTSVRTYRRWQKKNSLCLPSILQTYCWGNRWWQNRTETGDCCNNRCWKYRS